MEKKPIINFCPLFQIPLDQVNLADDEMIVPVAHFHREAYVAFGVPFLIKIKEGETYDAVKERIRVQLDVPEKEFEKYRMALVSNNRPHYFDEEGGPTDAHHVKLSQFQTSGPLFQGGQQQGNLQYPHPSRPYIGLQHANKASKRARYNYMEKAIKIYN